MIPTTTAGRKCNFRTVRLHGTDAPSRSAGHVALAHEYDDTPAIVLDLDDCTRLLAAAIAPAEQLAERAGLEQPPHDGRARGVARGLDQHVALSDHCLADAWREQQRRRVALDP